MPIVGKIEAILELRDRMSKKLHGATKNMENFQSKVDKLGQDATRVGGAMTAGITVPLGLLAAAVIRTGAEFEKNMSGVAAVTGAVGPEFEKLKGLAQEMGETTVFTAGQSAEAMKAFGLAGFETEEIMNALRPTLNLAAAGAMDMGTAADIAAKVTRGYGIEAEGTTHAMDVLTKAFTTSNTDLQQLGNAFKMVGPVAKTAGTSFEMTTATLQVMANAGIAGSMSGRQLRRAMLRLVNPPGEAAKALKKLGVATSTADGRMRPFDQIVEELEPHLQNTAAMAEIFGTVAMPGMVAVLEQGADGLREMTKELENAGGTGQRIADVMLDNVAGSFVLFKSAIEGVFNALFTELEPVLRSLLAVGTKVAQFFSREMVPALASLDPTLKVLGVALLAVVAAAGPLIMAFGLLAPAIPAMQLAFAALTGVLTGPVVLFGILGAILVAYFAKSEKVRKIVGSMARIFVQLGKVALKILIGAFNVVIAVVEGFLDTLYAVSNFLTGGLLGKALEGLGFGLAFVADKLTEWTSASEEAVGEADAFVGPIQSVTEELGDMGEVIDDDVIPAIEDLTEEWETLAKQWRGGAIPQAKSMTKAIASIGGVTGLTKKELGGLSGTLNDALDKYHALGQIAPQTMVDLERETRNLLSTTLDLTKIVGGFKNTLSFDEVFPWLSKKNKPTLTAFKLLPEVVVGGQLDAEMLTIGQNLAARMKQGFGSIIEGLPDTVIGAFKGGGGMMGALGAIGAQMGSSVGGSIGSALGSKMSAFATDKEGGIGKLIGGISGMAGPIGAAIGALAGPLIGGLTKLFSGPTVAESVRKTSKRMFTKGISVGLSEAIEGTRESVGSDFAAMMMHMSSIIDEQGGVMAMGIEKAVRRVRDIFSAVEQGSLSTAQAATTFGESFTKIADALVESGGIASAKFVELITLAERFGTTAATLKFVGEQAKITSEGLAALFGPTIAESDKLNESIEKQREAIKGMNSDTVEGAIQVQAATENLNGLLKEQSELGEKSKGELADLGIVAIASFEGALRAGMSFSEAVEKHGPAIDAVIKAQESLGITTDNVALKQLSQFAERVEQNKGLVAGVEALDSTMLALSRTGSLNAESLGAMERQGMRMYEKLIGAGFSQNEAIMMMGPSLKTMMEAHEKLGIPIDENTQKLLAQAKEAGAMEKDQETGWGKVEAAVMKVVESLDKFINRIAGVDKGLRNIPTKIQVELDIEENYRSGNRGGGQGMPGHGDGMPFAKGGIVTQPTLGLVGEAGPEAVIPLSKFDMNNEALLSEVRGLRTELRNLPLHLRDAIILAQ